LCNNDFDFSNRQKERKQKEQQKLQDELEAKRLQEEERKRISGAKVKQWMHKKKVQKNAEKVEQQKKEYDDAASAAKKKNADLKKVISYDDWLKQKNEETKTSQKQTEEKKSVDVTYQKCRESVSRASYEKWIRESHTKPKPPKLNRGVETLIAVSSKMYVNPRPWQCE